MRVIEWIFLILIVLPFLNLLLLSAYCRYADRVDRRKKADVDPQESKEAGLEKEKNQAKNRLKNANQYFYGWMRYSGILVGRFPSNRVRNWIFRHVFCMKATKQTVINGGCEFRSPWNIKAGNCIIGNNNLLDGRSGIEIGDHVVFGADVRVWTMEHDVDDPWFRVTKGHALPVKIKDHAWICSGVTILPGTYIGVGAVAASRACITKDCDDYGIYGGIPAKKIGDRIHDLKYTLSGKPTWHFY